MGFTRHFTQFRHLEDTEWTEFRTRAMGILEEYFADDAYPADEKSITFEFYAKHRFQINGEGDNSYESFCIMPDALGYNFCKTASEPYDLYVAALMLLLKYIAPGAFRIRADGEDGHPTTLLENWEDASALLYQHLGRTDLRVVFNPDNEGVDLE